MSKKKKPVVKYSKKIAEAICDLVSQGLTVEETIRTDPMKFPTATSVYRWSRDKPEFEAMLNNAYSCFLFVKMEELREISSTEWCVEHLDDFGGDYKLAFEARRAKMDALKFLLGKLAPILSKRFSNKQEIEVSGTANLGTQILIQNYSTPDTPEKKITQDKPTVFELEDGERDEEAYRNLGNDEEV